MKSFLVSIPYTKLIFTGIVIGVGIYVGLKLMRFVVKKTLLDDIYLPDRERREIVVH